MNIVIAGGTCSGKTTLAKEIKNLTSKAVIFPQDNYFKNLKDIPKYKGGYLMDSINAFNYPEYQKDYAELLKKGEVYIPNYDLESNQRKSKDILLKKEDLIILEGLHTIKIFASMKSSLKVFLLVDLEECLKRKIERDSNKYQISPKIITEYFREFIIPMYKEYILPQKKEADIVIEKEEDVKCFLKKYIRS